MAQAQKITSGVAPLPDGGYVVIDNSGPGNLSGNGGTYGSLVAGASGYDSTLGNSLSGTAGALGQGINTYTNGTIPDCVANGTTTAVQNGTMGIFVRWKNPA